MGRLATYYIKNHKIEVVKTLTGKEKVLLNGITISEMKTSGITTEHKFQIDKHCFKISKRERFAAEKMNTFKVFKNGSPIALINMESQRSDKILLLIITVGLGLGYMVGMLVYSMML